MTFSAAVMLSWGGETSEYASTCDLLGELLAAASQMLAAKLRYLISASGHDGSSSTRDGAQQRLPPVLKTRMGRMGTRPPSVRVSVIEPCIISRALQFGQDWQHASTICVNVAVATNTT